MGSGRQKTYLRRVRSNDRLGATSSSSIKAPERLIKMSRVLYRIGHFAGRHPWRVVAGWIALAAAVFMLNGAAGGAFDESFSVPGAESQRAADAIEDRFPQETLYTSNVIFHSDEGLTKPELKKADRADGRRARAG